MKHVLLILLLLGSFLVKAEDFKTHFINVGQADATVLEFNKGLVMIDAGAEINGVKASRDSLMNYLNRLFERRKDLNKTIDVLIITHNHKDHYKLIGDLSKAFIIKHIIANNYNLPKDLTDAAQQEGAPLQLIDYHLIDSLLPNGLTLATNHLVKAGSLVPRITIYSGQVYVTGKTTLHGRTFTKKNFDTENNHSLVIKVVYGEARMLFTGDLQDKGIDYLFAKYHNHLDRFDVDFYHVGHHGAENGTTRELLDVLSPEIAVISAGDSSHHQVGSAHGHRHPRILTLDLLMQSPSLSSLPEKTTVYGYPERKTDAQGKKYAPAPEPYALDKAIYCTCWSGSLVMLVDADGTFRMQPKSEEKALPVPLQIPTQKTKTKTMNLANNNILLLLIALIFIYACLSILTSILLEWYNHRKKERGTMLKDSIYKLLKDPLNLDYGALFYEQYIIHELKHQHDRLPQYISSRMFAETLVDVLIRQEEHTVSLQQKMSEGTKRYAVFRTRDKDLPVMEKMERALTHMNPSPFRDLLYSYLEKSGPDYAKFIRYLESWYNDYMDRVSGWYKNKQRKRTLFFGFAIAIILNVDSLHLLKMLNMDEDLRNRLVEQAEQANDQRAAQDSVTRNTLNGMIALLRDTNVTQTNDSVSRLQNKQTIATLQNWLTKYPDSSQYQSQADTVLELIAGMELPIGWSCDEAPLSWFQKEQKAFHPAPEYAGNPLVKYATKRNTWSWGNLFRYLSGIIITGVSLSFGAPFWFDLLSKFINIRRSGKIPESKAS